VLEAMLELNVVVVLVVLADSSVETLYESSIVESWTEDGCPGNGAKVHTHSLRLFRRPATGVSGQASLSDSEDESRLSPVLGD